MKKIFIIVEGYTEERFVKDVLYDYFLSKSIVVIPIIVTTKIVRDGANYRGGWVSYRNVKRDIFKLLQDNSIDMVTTMLDYYGLPNDYPKWESSSNCYKSVEVAEYAFYTDINSEKFLPYLQLHEFEGLIFSSPENIVNTLGVGKSTKLTEVKNHLKGHKSPEEINQGIATHPSNRIIKMFMHYNKPVHGTLIAKRTGLEKIMNSCPHFKQWLQKLSQQ